MDEATERKNRSIKILKQYHIPYIEHLPVIETQSEANLKTKQEIAERAICCLVAVQHAIDIINDEDVEGSREFLHSMLEAWGLLEKMTENEQALLAGELEADKVETFPWRYEAYWVLVWALGFVDELGLPTNCCDENEALDIVSQYKNFDKFLQAANERQIKDILDEADLVYRILWDCVEARLKGQEGSAGFNPDVVVERHIAFNWLTGYDDDWDNACVDY